METTYGLYFRREDYATFWRRSLIVVIDALVVGAVCSALFVALWATFPFREMLGELILATCVVAAFCYFVVLKRSKVGTLGYRVGGVRIVGLDGQTPSFFSLTQRLLFAPMGPVMWFLDLIWLSGDTHRQALRDKFAETYVIKRNAEPVGRGRLVYRYYEILGYNFLFREIEVQTTTNA